MVRHKGAVTAQSNKGRAYRQAPNLAPGLRLPRLSPHTVCAAQLSAGLLLLPLLLQAASLTPPGVGPVHASSIADAACSIHARVGGVAHHLHTGWRVIVGRVVVLQHMSQHGITQHNTCCWELIHSHSTGSTSVSMLSCSDTG